jgi:hypothetical protein
MKPTFLAGIVLSLALAGRAPAINLLVYTTTDSGAGSLRQCIADNAALGGGSTIIFSNVVTGTITLTNGELLITNNVTILGPGANVLAVDGNAASSVFHINNGVTTAISGLTITNGNSADDGGGIYNDHSTVTVSNCTLSSNSGSDWGGGIFNFGYGGSAALMVVASTLSGNSAGAGGGIYNDGYGGSAALTVVASTLSGNSADDVGGGIYNDGLEGSATLTVIASTFSGNSADDVGGGIYNDGLEGSATLTVIASTFSGNSASQGGGIYNHTCYTQSATLTVVASTFNGNSASQGGGIFNDAYDSCPDIANYLSGQSAASPGNTTGATLEIGDTILNAGASGENITNMSGTIMSDGYNLSSDAAGGDDHSTGPGGLLNAPGDIRNTDPMLGPLTDNGGTTFTHALLPGSPATDQGNSFGLTTDQRGFPRPVVDPCIADASGGDGSDIGAFEVQQVCRPVVFAITAIGRIGTGNDLRLSYATVLGSNYVVQTRSDMVSGSWANLPGTNVGIGVIMQSIVTNALAAPQGFYRIQQSP